MLPMMPGVPQRITHDYVRAGTTTLFAALEVATGKVIGSLHRRHRAEEFIWLNLVERWFTELTNKQMRRGVHSRPGPGEGHPCLDRRMEHRPQALGLDEDRS